MKYGYAFGAAIIGLFPGGMVLLVLLEAIMFYHICVNHKAPVLAEGLFLATGLIGVSFLFKSLAQFLHAIPLIGQLANSIVAFFVVLGLSKIFEIYAKHRSNG